MTWSSYPKDVQEKLRRDPSIRSAIQNMWRQGYAKEDACRITGAPYEVVDGIYQNNSDQRPVGHTTESELREKADQMVKARHAPRVVKAKEWAPLPKVERTEGEQEAFNRRMAHARAGRKKKD